MGPGKPGGCGEIKVQVEEGLAPFQEGKRDRGVGFRTRAVWGKEGSGAL